MADAEHTAPSPFLPAALQLASCGWRVIPLGEHRKAPVFKSWPELATTDPSKITQWWLRWPTSNIGVAFGTLPDGRVLFGLDIDERPQWSGGDTLAALEAEHGALPDGPTVLTPSGSMHRYFACEQTDLPEGVNKAGLIGPGLDVKAPGGQFVAPPSIHPDHVGGPPYQWEADHEPWALDVPDAPAWLLQCIRDAIPQQGGYRPHSTTVGQAIKLGAGGGPRAGDVLNERVTWGALLERDGATFEGTHVTRWRDDGGALVAAEVELWRRPDGPAGPSTGHHSATLGYGGNDVLYVFTDSWPTDVPGKFLEQHTSYTRFGYYVAVRYGDTSPEHMSEGARALADTWGLNRPALVPEPIRQPEPMPAPGDVPGLPPLPPEPITLGAPVLQFPLAPPAPEGARNWITEQTHSLDYWRSQPPPSWLLQGLIQQDSLTAIYGPPKHGKSWLVLDMALHLALGRPWRSAWTAPTSVLYLAGEGRHVSVQRLSEAERMLGRADPRMLQVTHGVPDLHGGVDDVRLLAEHVAREGTQLVIIDTLARAIPGAEENSSKDMGVAIKRLDWLREQTGCSVLVVHHAGKDGTKGMRGSTALLGAVDVGIRCTKERVDVGDVYTVELTDSKVTETGARWHFRLEDRGGPQPVWAPFHPTGLTTAPGATEHHKPSIIELDVLKRLQLMDDGTGVPWFRWLTVVLGDKVVTTKGAAMEVRNSLEATGLVADNGKVARARLWHVTTAGQMALHDAAG